MENIKLKRRGVFKKNCGSSLGKKSHRRTMKKKRGKANTKTLFAGHECWSLTAQEGGVAAGRVAKIIKRRALNEVNEARKEEDICRIVDLRRIFYQKEERRRNQIDDDSANKKTQEPSSSDEVPCSGEESNCFSSPVSLAPVRMEVHPLEEQYGTSVRGKTLDLKKELRSFSLKYAAAVRSHILHKLPAKGVLEDALNVLTALPHTMCFDPESSKPVAVEKETSFVSSQKEENRLRHQVPFNENFHSLVGVSHFPGDFMSNPLENVFIVQHPVAGNGNHPSPLSPFYNDCDKERSQSVIEVCEKDFQKSGKHLDIVTPPIHFYRRNMF